MRAGSLLLRANRNCKNLCDTAPFGHGSVPAPGQLSDMPASEGAEGFYVFHR